MMSWPPENTIQTLRVRYVGSAQEAHTPALQLRLERILRDLDWRPRGMKPGAVLLIRRLTGLPPLDGSNNLSLDWERAFQDRLQTLYERAVRPRGYIPADVESILFDDEAVLVLGLTYELVTAAPALPRAWYWQQVLRMENSRTSGQALAALWMHHIATLPAVCASLPPEQVIAYAHLLTAEDGEALIQTLRQAFKLPPTRRVREPDPGLGSRAPDSIKAPDRMISYPEAGSEKLAPAPRPPCPIGLPKSVNQLTPPVQALIVWAILLRRAPAYARSYDYARQVDAWLEAVQTRSPAGRQRAASLQRPPITEPRPVSSHHEVPKSTPAQAASAETEPVYEFVPLPDAVEGVWTRLGGVLFLYHVLRWLDLPGVWDERISAWAAIEALACALLGGRRFGNDPIWSALAALDGREPGARIGEDVNEPRPFALPKQWISRYGDSLKAILSDGAWPSDADTWIAPHAAEWLQGAIPIIRALLTAAIPDPDLTPEDVIELVIVRGGRLSISNTHIDLYMPTGDADARLRRAGLDLDPGWVPDLGYIVLFHYTE